jgi:ubiquinone/menaquinone biosynthesis C-methylase UbiE
MTKPHLQSNFAFRLMSLEFRLRDLLRPPTRILRGIGVRPGMTVLDFGCGPGGFSLAAAQLVGPGGRVFAVDIHPLAIQSVQRAASRRGISNIETIFTGGLANVPEASIDVALLYDVLHEIPEPALTLAEIRRVLKPDGVLSVSDHHLQKDAIVAAVTDGSLFRSSGCDRWTLRFEPAKVSEPQR